MSTLSRILSAGPLAASIPLLLQMSNQASDDAMSVLASAEARILGVMLSQLASETKRNADAVVAINESLHVLTRLEQGQGHVLDSLKEGRIKMEKHESRLQEIEKHMPALIESRRWVVSGVLAGVGMIALALVKLVILDVPRIPAYSPAIYATPAPAPQQPAPAAPAAPARP